ncbi:hypothetical protein HB777_36540 (plasmid) [Mesorhizobium loti]|nr:hypothetical protein HB777_36540 [Mesorhizobium loti]
MNSYADISLRFENCSFHSEKFHWGCIVDYFEYATYDQLFNSFPCDGFVLTEKAGGPSAKSYKTYNLMVMKNGERKPEYYGLTPLWQEAVSALVGDHNIAGLEKLTGKSLGGDVGRSAVRDLFGRMLDWPASGPSGQTPHPNRLSAAPSRPTGRGGIF